MVEGEPLQMDLHLALTTFMSAFTSPLEKPWVKLQARPPRTLHPFSSVPPAVIDSCDARQKPHTSSSQCGRAPKC